MSSLILSLTLSLNFMSYPENAFVTENEVSTILYVLFSVCVCIRFFHIHVNLFIPTCGIGFKIHVSVFPAYCKKKTRRQE